MGKTKLPLSIVLQYTCLNSMNLFCMSFLWQLILLLFHNFLVGTYNMVFNIQDSSLPEFSGFFSSPKTQVGIFVLATRGNDLHCI